MTPADKEAALRGVEMTFEVTAGWNTLAESPECKGGYPEVCPVCQLDGHPVVEKLRAELASLRSKQLDLLDALEELMRHSRPNLHEEDDFECAVSQAKAALSSAPSDKERG